MLGSGPACAPAAVVGSNGVSAESLFKTGVFAVLAGDFREFLAKVAALGAWRLVRNARKPRELQAFHA